MLHTEPRALVVVVVVVVVVVIVVVVVVTNSQSKLKSDVTRNFAHGGK